MSVGMALVGLAMVKWAPHVPDRAFRVLMRMAYTALDAPKDGKPANVFNGGRDLLESVLRAERGGSPEAVETALKRAISDLVKLGAIERLNKARYGKRAEYKLTLDNPIRIDEPLVDNSEEGDTHVYPLGDTHVPPEGDTRVPRRGTPTCPPRRHIGDIQELEEEIGVEAGPPLTVRARDAPASEKQNECPEPTCAMGYILDTNKRNIRCPRCNPATTPPNVIQFRKTKGKSA